MNVSRINTNATYYFDMTNPVIETNEPNSVCQLKSIEYKSDLVDCNTQIAIAAKGEFNGNTYRMVVAEIPAESLKNLLDALIDTGRR